MSARMLAKVVICLVAACCPFVAVADTVVANRHPQDLLANDIDRLVATSGVTSRMHSLLVSQGGELIFER